MARKGRWGEEAEAGGSGKTGESGKTGRSGKTPPQFQDLPQLVMQPVRQGRRVALFCGITRRP